MENSFRALFSPLEAQHRRREILMIVEGGKRGAGESLALHATVIMNVLCFWFPKDRQSLNNFVIKKVMGRGRNVIRELYDDPTPNVRLEHFYGQPVYLCSTHLS